MLSLMSSIRDIVAYLLWLFSITGKKCHYCDNRATRTLIWLKTKRGSPAEISLPWCGCDLMENCINKIYTHPYQIKEGEDYKYEEGVK